MCVIRRKFSQRLARAVDVPCLRTRHWIAKDLAAVARSLTSKSEIRTWESEEQPYGCCNHDK